LRDATQRQFFELCERAELPYQLHRAENRVTMLHSNSDILFRSLDNFERLRGPNLAWFGIDELTYTAPEAWLRLEARLRDGYATRLCGFGVFTPAGFDWVYRKFASKRAKGYQLIQAAPFENRFMLDAVPDFYERLRYSYDPRFYEQEVLGQFLNVRQGRAYYGFSRREHVHEKAYDNTLPIHWTWDFNVSPMSSLICQRHGDEIWVLDEIVLQTSSTPEVCREFIDRWGKHGHGPNRKLLIYGDASGAASRSVTGRSDYHVIREFFRTEPEFDLRLQVPPSNPPVRDRVNNVNARLVNAAGQRQVFIDPRCKELVADLEQVVYKAGSTQIDKESDPARTHTSDALGYYLCQAFAEPVGEKTRRLI
jgi:hypothetical protein